VILSSAQLDFVVRAKCRRLLVPLERGDLGEMLAAPVEVGQVVSLQPRPFVKGVRTTVVGMALVDPSTVPQPRVAVAPCGERAWLMEFVFGDHAEFFAKHREQYLKAKGVGLTDNPARGARGEPAVTTDEQLAFARQAREKRRLEEQQRRGMHRRAIQTALDAMRREGVDREREGDIRFIERRLAKMDRRAEDTAA
jgi:hypothetical protein